MPYKKLTCDNAPFVFGALDALRIKLRGQTPTDQPPGVIYDRDLNCCLVGTDLDQPVVVGIHTGVSPLFDANFSRPRAKLYLLYGSWGRSNPRVEVIIENERQILEAHPAAGRSACASAWEWTPPSGKETADLFDVQLKYPLSPGKTEPISKRLHLSGAPAPDRHIVNFLEAIQKSLQDANSILEHRIFEFRNRKWLRPIGKELILGAIGDPEANSPGLTASMLAELSDHAHLNFQLALLHCQLEKVEERFPNAGNLKYTAAEYLDYGIDVTYETLEGLLAVDNFAIRRLADTELLHHCVLELKNVFDDRDRCKILARLRERTRVAVAKDDESPQSFASTRRNLLEGLVWVKVPHAAFGNLRGGPTHHREAVKSLLKRICGISKPLNLGIVFLDVDELAMLEELSNVIGDLCFTQKCCHPQNFFFQESRNGMSAFGFPTAMSSPGGPLLLSLPQEEPKTKVTISSQRIPSKKDND